MRDTRRTRALLAALLLTSCVLITLDVRGGIGSPVASLRVAAAQVFGPVQRAAAAVVEPIARGVEDVRTLGDSDAEIQRLRRENDAMRLELRSSEVTRARAAELDALLKVAGLGQYRVVPARVIALGAAQGFSSTVTIDAGSRDGLAQDMAVVNGEGLVGRLKTVGLLTATVLVVNDPTFAVGVRAEGTLEAGFAIGGGQGPMELTMLNPQVPLDVGDRLVTRGSRDNAPFAPGIPVGEVGSLNSSPGTLTRVGTVTPFVDVDAIELVGVVVQPPREDPRDSVLPAVPPPTPTLPAPSPFPFPWPVPMSAGTGSPVASPAPGPGGGPTPSSPQAPIRTPAPAPAPTSLPSSAAPSAPKPTPAPAPTPTPAPTPAPSPAPAPPPATPAPTPAPPTAAASAPAPPPPAGPTPPATGG